MIRYIMAPVIGAIIGYATNWIAVKMLFFPHHEVRVLGRKLPFTPGVIPKGQRRLARAVGQAVEEQLLTVEVLEKVLLSEEIKEKVRMFTSEWLKEQEKSEQTLQEMLCKVMPEEKEEELADSLKTYLTGLIYGKLTGMNVGNIVASKVLEAAKEKLAESMFGMMIGGSMLEPVADIVEVRINEYVADHAWEYIQEMITDESEKLRAKTVGEGFLLLGQYDIDFQELVVSLYEDMVKEKLSAVLSSLKLAGIVEERINAMEVAEVEELLLSIMKKELGAIVNLGALIGFVLGLVNVVILLI